MGLCVLACFDENEDLVAAQEVVKFLDIFGDGFLRFILRFLDLLQQLADYLQGAMVFAVDQTIDIGHRIGHVATVGHGMEVDVSLLVEAQFVVAEANLVAEVEESLAGLAFEVVKQRCLHFVHTFQVEQGFVIAFVEHEFPAPIHLFEHIAVLRVRHEVAQLFREFVEVACALGFHQFFPHIVCFADALVFGLNGGGQCHTEVVHVDIIIADCLQSMPRHGCATNGGAHIDGGFCFRFHLQRDHQQFFGVEDVRWVFAVYNERGLLSHHLGHSRLIAFDENGQRVDVDDFLGFVYALQALFGHDVQLDHGFQPAITQAHQPFAEANPVLVVCNVLAARAEVASFLLGKQGFLEIALQNEALAVIGDELLAQNVPYANLVEEAQTQTGHFLHLIAQCHAECFLIGDTAQAYLDVDIDGALLLVAGVNEVRIAGFLVHHVDGTADKRDFACCRLIYLRHEEADAFALFIVAHHVGQLLVVEYDARLLLFVSQEMGCIVNGLGRPHQETAHVNAGFHGMLLPANIEQIHQAAHNHKCQHALQENLGRQ